MNENLKAKIGAMFMTGVPSNAKQDAFMNLRRELRIGNFDVSSDNALSVESLCALNASLRSLVYDYSGTYPIICIGLSNKR